jgi:peptide chain release factor 1
MFERLEDLEREYLDVEARLADPALQKDQKRYTELTRRYHELKTLVECGRELREAHENLGAARDLYTDAGAEDREMLRDEIEESEADIERLDEAWKLLLLPRDPNEGRNVIVEIRGAEGGEEANLFARDLYEMYRAYAQRQSWRLEVLGSRPSDLGGFAEITFLLQGDGVWTRMKHEAGPHRVQRVPVTESQGRVHTSSATVSVLPEAEEVDVDIDPNDLQIDVYRSSGPGGQSVNTTDSAVRITHRPTGVVVSMQDQKSQLQNRAKAMQVLRARILQRAQEEQASELSDQRKGQIGGGGRSEKVRTYNFKENRVSDHRIGLTIYKLDKVLAGELDEVSDALVADERSRQLSAVEGGADGETGSATLAAR